MAAFRSYYNKLQPQLQLDILTLFLFFLNIYLLDRFQTAAQPKVAQSVRETANPDWLSDWHVSLERAMLVYSQTNISLHKKAVRGSSLTETEGFVLQDYPICIFLITAQAHRTTWFGMIKEAKRRNWGWLDQDSGFVNILNYIWGEIQQSPNHNRKTVGFHIWLQRLWLKFLLAYKQKETWLLPVEGLNQNHLWILLLWAYTATYIQNGVLVE